MTSKELNERITGIFQALPSDAQITYEVDIWFNIELKQLIRDCIEAVTPKYIGEYEAWDLSFEVCCPGDDVVHGHKHAVESMKANTKELLG